jgi:hypothetical protein
MAAGAMSSALEPSASDRADTAGARVAVLPGVFDVALLAALWIGAVLVVNPLGNFPLNDDWAFGTFVQRFLERGEYRPPDWAPMPLISQGLWGGLFCLPCGFSFSALRFSTLSLALVGVIALYVLLRQLGASRWLAMAGTLTLAFNPIFFALSFTFMTDVPFTALVVLSVVALRGALVRDSGTMLVLGVLATTACVLCRQLGLFLPAAFAIAYVGRHGVSGRSLVRGLIPLAIGLAAYFGYRCWLAAHGLRPERFDLKNNELLSALTRGGFSTRRLFWNVLTAMLYYGLFLLPVLPALCAPRGKWQKRSAMLAGGAAAFFVATASFVLCCHRTLMPLAGNVLAEWGIGPALLRDLFTLKLPHLPPLPGAFWIAVTVLSVAGGGVLLGAAVSLLPLVAAILRAGRLSSAIAVWLFLAAGCAIYCAPLLLTKFYDRYLIAILPLLICLAVMSAAGASAGRQRLSIAIVGSMVAVWMVYSVAATRDYMTWNRARWDLLQVAISKGVRPTRIDGGLEFNALYFYDPGYRHSGEKSWWWVHDDQYLVAMGSVSGYEMVSRRGYQRWLPPQRAQVLLLRRLPAAESEKGAKGSGEAGWGNEKG